VSATVRVPLEQIARARSGDKGNSSNVGLIADSDALYDVIRKEVTLERVAAHFGALVKGRVERYELPNLRALNFILHESLGGGGSASLRTDAQGKTHGQALLLMQIDVPEPLLKDARGVAPAPSPGARR